ncbi:MAG: hemolysin family protein [Lachnospiraceae bacterium]
MEDSSSPYWGIVFFALFVIINGMFYGFLAALQKTDREQFTEDTIQDNKKARRIGSFVRAPLLIYNTAIVVTFTFALVFGGIFIRSFSAILTEHMPQPLAFCIVVLAAMIVFVLFGVSLPRKISACYHEKAIYLLVDFVAFFRIVFWPLVTPVFFLSAVLAKVFRVNPSNSKEEINEQEIISMVDEAHEQGVIEESEAEMIQNIMDFSDTDAKDIMIHRKNINALDSQSSLKEAIAFMLERNNSRYPVYNENIDDILGLIHLKDAFRIIHEEKTDLQTPLISIPGLVRRVEFVPETRSLNGLFEYMQTEKLYMVIVIDEYGQTASIVSMEDILEEIVGEILDEYDDDIPNFTVQHDSCILIEGLTPLEEVEEELKITLGDEFDTLSGFLTDQLGHVPTLADTYVDAAGYRLEILAVEDNTVKRVRAYAMEKEGEEKCQDTQNLPT